MFSLFLFLMSIFNFTKATNHLALGEKLFYKIKAKLLIINQIFKLILIAN